jgi:hypothetical protein
MKTEAKGPQKRFYRNETPLFGREAMIYSIEDEMKLIRTLRTENKEEYRRLYFIKRNSS